MNNKARLWSCGFLASVFLASQASAQQMPPAPNVRPSADPVWKWSDEQISTFWNQLSAGPGLKPAAWPNNAKVAVAFSFDFQMGTIYEPGPAASTNTNSQYDGRVGLPRILKILDKHKVPASFFVTGITAKLYPDVIREITASGRNEIGVHGYVHENVTQVPPEDERRLLIKALDALEAVTGKRPVGYRSPAWNFSGATLDILRDQHMLYDSGMMADDDPYEIIVKGKPTGLLEIPVEWSRDDAMFYTRQSPLTPDEVLSNLKAEFDQAYEEHGLFQMTMHPRISGHRARSQVLEKLIVYINQHPGVWYATHEQVARYVQDLKEKR